MSISHVIVDGSNIATEGRTAPSLKQLDEAVRALLAEYPDVTLTVIVDATFGHRIDESERPEFEAGIVNGELVTPRTSAQLGADPLRARVLPDDRGGERTPAGTLAAPLTLAAGRTS